MAKTKKRNIIWLSLILILLVSVFFSIQNPAIASVIKDNYKKYKAKYKNKEDKLSYYKIKALRKDSNKLYFYWKAICDAHKFDSPSQFKKLSQKTQDMCNDYYSYKGFQQYIGYRNKYRNSDNNEETATETPFVCGTSTVLDADGNSYGTVLVNDQCWMAENMNVGTMLASAATNPTDNGIIEKWCYNNDSAICATDGGLYNWNEAMQYVTTDGAQGICPTGWHIPTDAEQYTLENYLKDEGESCDSGRSGAACNPAGTRLKAGGSSGLNFPLAGICAGVYAARNSHGDWWSSTQPTPGGNIRNRDLTTGSTVGRFVSSASGGLSVRCLKD